MAKHNTPQKLELTWIGKGDEPKLEPRILIENLDFSYWAGKEKGAPAPAEPDGMLIHGDNLLALKALEQEYAGKVKCIYIDPPYNTGSAFEHYDDGIEHSLWLSLMNDRIRKLFDLLSDDGSLWISIDDNECHYLKVLCDEIFGRNNFIANVIWQKRTSPDIRATIGAGHDYILVYAKNAEKFKSIINKLPKTEEQKSLFKNPDKDARGAWVSSDFTAQGYRPNQMYTITTPSGKKYTPPEGRCWKNIEAVYRRLHDEGRMWYGKDGNSVPRRKTYLNELDGVAAWTWWPNSEVGHTQESKKEIIDLFGAKNIFDTPKPERLINRIITLATNRNELVLDSFLGSATTAAVAQKMGRKWIGIELGEHAETHCLPRMKKVVQGEQGGISKAVNWQGGGYFKYYNLAPSLLNKDKFGEWIISENYNATLLAAAMAKHEGFKYEPHESLYWKQGQSSERDFIYTTTQFITLEVLDSIHEEMRPDESLLICCKAFSKGCKDRYPNIQIKKIPHMLLGRCEFGKDDYSLNIVNLPEDPDAAITEEFVEEEIKPKKTKSKKKKEDAGEDQLTLL
ncbi:MAG: site-specific DNA-methyltransferase [Flavobacteriales bacterium]|nr:site-specific DNA-methyltransferase [Flavobacteriales bacterium]